MPELDLKNMIPEIIASCVCLVVMVIFVPLFLKAAWPDKSKKSLLFKMICATSFVIIALLQMRIADNYSDFAKLVIGGLVLSWFGDLFLHIPTKKAKVWYPFGVLSFLSGHVLFVGAYALAGNRLLDASFWNLTEIAVFAPVIAAVMAYLLYMSKKSANKIIPFLIIYATAVFAMMIKATSLGIGLFIDGQQSLLVTFLLAVGGIFFVTSDLLLLLIDFGDLPGKTARFKNFKLKSVNIWTYFIAQCLLGFTILFIRA